jgi:hypothetical protein
MQRKQRTTKQTPNYDDDNSKLKQLLDGDSALGDTSHGARTQTEIPTLRRWLQQTSGHALCYTGTLWTRLLQLQTRRKRRVQRMLHQGMNEDRKTRGATGA